MLRCEAARAAFTKAGLVCRWWCAGRGVTKPGSLCDVPAIHVDLFPTFMEIAGAKGARPNSRWREPRRAPCATPPPACGATPSISIFRGISVPGPIIGARPPVGLIQRGDWKLMEFFEDGRLELYNLKTDVGEQKNLAQQQPELTKELHAKLLAWRKGIQAKMPSPHKTGEEPPGVKGKKTRAG